MSIPSENHQPPGATARPTSLSDRVRSLRLPSRQAGARSSRLPWFLCLLLLVSTVLFGIRAFRAPRAEPAKNNELTERPTAGSEDIVLESKGNIIPAHQIQVSPLVSGKVLKLNLVEGVLVREGDILAEIETTEYESDFLSAKYALASAEEKVKIQTRNREEEVTVAEAELREARALADQAEKEHKRLDRIANTPASGVSRSDLDKAKADELSRKHRVDVLDARLKMMKEGPRLEMRRSAEADVKAARAVLTKAEWRLDNCKVRAPITGTILTKKAEKGNMVNPAAFNVSASLCEMADLSDLEVELFIQERDIAQVVIGQKCRITPEGYRDRKYEGFVAREMPIADRAKGAIPVRVRLARFTVQEQTLEKLKQADLPDSVRNKLKSLTYKTFHSETLFLNELAKILTPEELQQHKSDLLTHCAQSTVPAGEEGKILKPETSVIVSFLKPE